MMQEDLFYKLEAKLSQLYQVYDRSEYGRKLEQSCDDSKYRVESLSSFLEIPAYDSGIPHEPFMDLATSGNTSDCYEVD